MPNSSQVFRVGADPLLAQELATKNYIDTLNVCMVGFSNNVNISINGVGYWGLFNQTNRTSFGQAQSPIGLGRGNYVNFHCNVRTNTKDEDTIVGIRTAGFTTEVSLIVGAALTGVFSVNGLDRQFNEADLTAGRIDTLLSTSGSFSITTGHATMTVNEIGT